MRQAGKVQTLKLADLQPNPRNYRAHPADQLNRLEQSLARHGQYRPVVVQASTLKIIAGHGVVEAAKQAGETTISAVVVDVTDEEARAVLVDDNELARHAEDDREELAVLLADLHDTEFAPLAYNGEEIEDLLRELTMPRMGEDGAGGMTAEELAAEWMGLPEVDREGTEPAFNVIVWCKNETERDQFMVNND